jgi:hypothetical protein
MFSIDEAALGEDNTRLLFDLGSRKATEGYSSGQRGQTVNLLTYVYEGSNPSPSTSRLIAGVRRV